jgi:hypothetical protein
LLQGWQERKPRSGGGKKTTKDETDSNEETSLGIGETCFSLQTEVETTRDILIKPMVDQ